MRRIGRLPLLRGLNTQRFARRAGLAALALVTLACSSAGSDTVASPEDPPPARTGADDGAVSADGSPGDADGNDIPDGPRPDGDGPGIDDAAENQAAAELAELAAERAAETEALRAAVDAFEIAPIEWTPCGGFGCATFAVPLDHLDPDGPTIDLALRRRSASGGDPIGTLFINPGGPGGSGYDMLSWFSGDPRTLANFDVVGFDPRGVGASTSPDCSIDLTDGPLPDFSPDDQREIDQIDALWADFAARCAAASGDLLPHLGTEAVVADLDLLRRAVGDDQLWFVGYSYGSDIGLVYADLFGDRVGRMVLDGIVDPSHALPDVLAGQAAGFDDVLDRADAACGSSFSCGEGGLLATYDRVHAALESAPVGGVGPTELDTAMIIAGYDQGLWATLAQALIQADNGDLSLVERLSDAYYGLVDFTAYVSVNCIDSPSPNDPAGWDAFTDRMREVSPRFGATVASDMRACAHWPVKTDDPATAITAPDAPPIVIIGTVGDPATPFANAERVAAELERGVLVTHDGEGHTVYGNGNRCVDDLVAAYLVDAVVPERGIVCPA